MLDLEEKKYTPSVDIILLTEAEYVKHKDDENKITFYTELSQISPAQLVQYVPIDIMDTISLIRNMTNNYIYNIKLNKITIDEIDSDAIFGKI